ncbi:hypothetical protein GCM10023311_05070 [Flaviramulus aquimarinus]|uniref:PpiC domain-containing protein n=1 Tax=Flaviramulus aquimarinus TaxID=1170456 RepID=A0ABP9EU63_9FLAO
MHKSLLILLFIPITTILTAQNSTESELKTLETLEQIESYLESKHSKKNKLITFNEEKHKTVLAKKLFKLSKGTTKTIKKDFEKIFYKIVEKTEKRYYRVGYIVLDENQMDINNINTIRKRIITKYNYGVPFDFLAKNYSKDSNATRGGDTGWFTNGDNTYEFEKTIIDDTHKLNDIFTVDISETKKYYVFLKTHNPKNITEIKVLKIVETID